MEQKIYKYEIILNLLRGRNHLRKIAKDLKVNHMTIKRVLDSLIEENVLDVRVEGRNNIFSIKETFEAENLVKISEIYKLNKLIEKHPEFKQDFQKLRNTFDGLIIIFGSYAKGLETNKSDIDIFIETNHRKIKKRASKINKKFSIKIGEYDRKNLLIKEIEKNHIILRGLEVFYEKNKFFD